MGDQPVPDKKTAVAYLLWLFLGGLGLHHYYLRRPTLGTTVLGLTLIGLATVLLFFGLIPLIAVAVILVVDLFTIPRRVRAVNATIRAEHAASQRVPPG